MSLICCNCDEFPFFFLIVGPIGRKRKTSTVLPIHYDSSPSPSPPDRRPAIPNNSPIDAWPIDDIPPDRPTRPLNARLTAV
jgi:hypothetical protein